MSAPPNCYKCQFFYTTWEKTFPNGCHKFGFKCKPMPSIEVLSSSGQQCVFWTPIGGFPPPPEPEPPAPRWGSTFEISG